MSYQEELHAKLEAVRPTKKVENHKVNVASLEVKLINELQDEFEMAQYDLDESDILRSIKILEILHRYKESFQHPKALKIFYILARMEGVQAKNLLQLVTISTLEFKKIITTMARQKLVLSNEDKALELTLEGQSLAERIGVDVFI